MKMKAGWIVMGWNCRVLMKQRGWIGFWFVVAALTATADLFGGDAERHHSAEMNSNPVDVIRRAEGGVKVLFLGNSITLHGANISLGWTNVCGMAASTPDRDYVHLVTRGIERKTGRTADVHVRNIVKFERGYRNWDTAAMLSDEISFAPDYVVFAVGENAADLKDEEDRRAYRLAFSRLVGSFVKGRDVKPNIVVRGVFWPNEAKDAEMRRVADDYGVPFVPTALSGVPGMTAEGLFAHRGVASHPGDRGMREIANLILRAFFPGEPCAVGHP